MHVLHGSKQIMVKIRAASQVKLLKPSL